MTGVRIRRRILIPIDDIRSALADDGYPPRWLSVFIKRNLQRWQIADSVSFEIQSRDSVGRKVSNLHVGFIVGRFFADDTDREMDLVAGCVIQSLMVYGSALSNPDQLKEYQGNIEYQQALDGMVQGRSLLCLSKSGTMVVSASASQWLSKVMARSAMPGMAYLVQR